MNLPSLIEKVKSSIVHIVYVKDKKKVGSGTGFMLDRYLVTNYHVVDMPDDIGFLLRFHDSNPHNLEGLLYRYKDFFSFCKTGSDKNSYDFAVFDIPKLRERNLFQLSFGDPSSKRLGDDVIFLGYPLDHNNLVIHKGIISSFYESGSSKTQVIQIDASVNNSNSGGPLIDPETAEVIGIITRKGTGLSDMFKQLQKVFDENNESLKNAKNMMSLGGFDPVAAFEANQNQMKALCKEVERSANVGIGYAFSINHLLEDNLFYTQKKEEA